MVAIYQRLSPCGPATLLAWLETASRLNLCRISSLAFCLAAACFGILFHFSFVFIAGLAFDPFRFHNLIG